jgi:hypothetical protein
MKEINGANLDIQPKISNYPLENPPPKVFVKLLLPLLESSFGAKTVAVEQHETANIVIQKMFDKHYKPRMPGIINNYCYYRLLCSLLTSYWFLTEKNAQKFLLKVCGHAEYIVGDIPFYNFEHVRNCIRKKEQFINLALIEYVPVQNTSFLSSYDNKYFH